MSEVLVVVDHVDGTVKKPTYELLTIAKRLGEPSAVFIGPADKASEVADKVKKYGAEKVYVIAPSAAAAVQFASILRYLTGLARISLQYTAPDAG